MIKIETNAFINKIKLMNLRDINLSLNFQGNLSINLRLLINKILR